LRWRIYHGVWGSALFQSLYEPARGDMNAVMLMPEAYLAIGSIALLVALGALWTPLLVLAPLLLAASGALAVRAITHASTARFPTPGLSARQVAARRALTALLHLIQPLVRLEGRLRHGLTPWRRRAHGRAFPVTRRLEHWSEEWIDPAERLGAVESAITAAGAVVRRGGDFDTWDLETRGGTLAGVRVTTAVEEHGGGRQLLRMRCRPVWSPAALAITFVLLALCVAAGINGAVAAAVVLGIAGIALGLRTLSEASSALAITMGVVRGEDD
jgi:hypothetical protein